MRYPLNKEQEDFLLKALNYIHNGRELHSITKAWIGNIIDSGEYDEDEREYLTDLTQMIKDGEHSTRFMRTTTNLIQNRIGQT
jgi:uncharacterized protein YfkK (UPF0435 family)